MNPREIRTSEDGQEISIYHFGFENTRIPITVHRARKVERNGQIYVANTGSVSWSSSGSNRPEEIRQFALSLLTAADMLEGDQKEAINPHDPE